MRINYNVSAMLSNNALSTNDDLLSKSLERLSSGLKINHARIIRQDWQCPNV